MTGVVTCGGMVDALKPKSVFALVVELVDALASGASELARVGSSPTEGTGRHMDASRGIDAGTARKKNGRC
jgi:hypothetical protein